MGNYLAQEEVGTIARYCFFNKEPIILVIYARGGFTGAETGR
jgi:hypothetical protein